MMACNSHRRAQLLAAMVVLLGSYWSPVVVAGAAGLRAHQSDEINGMDSMDPAFSRDLQVSAFLLCRGGSLMDVLGGRVTVPML